MEQDIKRILEMLEDIKKDIELIKSKMGTEKEDREHTSAKRISAGPNISVPYTKVGDKSKWDVDSIDGLIE
jgi:glutaredoxin